MCDVILALGSVQHDILVLCTALDETTMVAEMNVLNRLLSSYECVF